MRPGQVVVLGDRVARLVVGVYGLGGEADEDGLPVVGELDNEGAVLPDAVVAGPTLRVALVHMHVVDAFAIVKGRAKEINGRVLGDGPVDQRLKLV